MRPLRILQYQAFKGVLHIQRIIDHDGVEPGTGGIELWIRLGVSLGVAPFEASRYPVLEFDYRVPAELRVDLIVEVDGRRRVVKFTDNDQTWPVIGRLRPSGLLTIVGRSFSS